jgi:hypothetical protein
LKLLRINGEEAIVLNTRPSKLPYDVYQNNDNHESKLEYVGSISQSITLQEAKAAEAGMDRALEQLRHNMHKYDMEKEAKK